MATTSANVTGNPASGDARSEDEQEVDIDLGDAAEKGCSNLPDVDSNDNNTQVARQWNRCWWSSLAIGYSLLVPYLSAKGAGAILESQASVAPPTLPESSMKTDFETIMSVEALKTTGYLWSLEGKAVVDEMLLLHKTHGSVKPALDKASRMVKENRRFNHACHPVLNRFAYLNYREGKHGIVSAFAGAIDFDDDDKAEVERILSGGTSLETGHNELPLPTVVDGLMICSGAYMHGVIRTFLADAGLVGQIEAAMHFVKRRLLPRLQSSQRAVTVFHQALGHALYDHRRHFVRIRAMEEALDLGVHEPLRKEFFLALTSGVWMAMQLSSSIWTHDIDDPAQIMSVCAVPHIQEQMRGNVKICSTMAPVNYLAHRLGGYVEAFEWCKKGCWSSFPSEQAADCETHCVKGTGRYMYGESGHLGGDLITWAYIGRTCSKASTSDLLTYCMSGAQGLYRHNMGEAFDAELCSGIDDPHIADACRKADFAM